MSIFFEISIIVAFLITTFICFGVANYCQMKYILQYLEEQLKLMNRNYNESYLDIFKTLFIVGSKHVDFFKLSSLSLEKKSKPNDLYNALFNKHTNIKSKFNKNIIIIFLLVFLILLNLWLIYILEFHTKGITLMLFVGVAMPFLYIFIIIDSLKDYHKCIHPKKKILLSDISQLYQNFGTNREIVSSLWGYSDDLSHYQEVQEEVFNYLEVLCLYVINDTWDNLDTLTEGFINKIDTLQETLLANNVSDNKNTVPKELISIKESHFLQ